MFIAHLPAGYLLWRSTNRRLAMVPCLVGSVLPDVDLIAIYGFDIAQNHHNFITHRPAIWLTCLLIALALRNRWVLSLALAATLHVMLDSVCGRIDWAWPIGQIPITLISVPARYDFWIWNFVLHWSFAIELALCVAALGMLVFQRKTPASQKTGVSKT